MGRIFGLSRTGRSRIGRVWWRVLAWTTVTVFAAGLGSMIWLERRLGMATSLEDFMLFVGFGAFSVVGSLLVANRPDNPVSWIMVTIGLMTGLFPAAETYAAYIMTTRGSPDPLAVFGAWANNLYWMPLLALVLIYLPLLFPDGRLPSPRWLPVAVIPAIALAGLLALGAFTETLHGQNIDYQIDNPIGLAGMPLIEQHPMFPVLTIGLFTGLFGAVVAVFVRFRQSSGVVRQQLKWFLYAVALTPVLTLYFITDPFPLVGDLVFGLVLICLPTAIGVAVLRYRLYDIDILIRRTLSYTVLTGLLASIYFGVVVLVQPILRGLTGNPDSPFVTVLSTLAIAALFNPLRHRVQNVIDRRFYRQRYNVEETLQRFAATLRDEVDLDRLSDHILSVVQETMRPESVSLWIREPNKRTLRIGNE
jgi:hypothetical protein